MCLHLPRLPIPRAKQEIMINVKVVGVENDERQGVVPREPVDQPVRDGADDAAEREDGPQPAEDAHVAELVGLLVRLLVARSGPEQLDTEEAVLDGRQVGVRLHDHDVLHVEAVLGLGPEAEEQRTVDDGRDGKGQVVVLEPLWADEEKERAGDGRDEDAE